jgi:DNA-directed RNA polymerase omega subunit
MKREEDSLIYPSLERLLEKMPQKYELVLAATRRAKQILREQRLNPAALDMDDKRRKPLSIALEDIIEGRVDQQALIQPDLEFDDLGEDQLDMFPDVEGAERSTAEGDEEAETETDDDSDDDVDSIGDIDIFDLSDDNETE